MASRRRGAHAAARPAALPFGIARRAPRPAAGGRAQLDGGTGGKRVTNGAKGGKRPGGVRARMSPLRVFLAVAVVGFGVMGFYGGLLSSSSAEPTVQAFLLDWAQQDYRAAAALTTGDQATVAGQLRSAYRQLHAAAFYLNMGHIDQHPDTAEAFFHASVDLGQDGAPWNYEGQFALRRSGSSWRIVWSPSVINPGLRPGLRLAVVTSMPQRAQLLDASGKPLQNPSRVYAVGVRPDSLTSPATTADALGRVARLDSAQLLGQIVAAPQQTRFLQLLTLSPASYDWLHGPLSQVPGLVIKPETERLFTSIASDVVGDVGTEISPVLRKEGVSYYPGTTVGVSGLQQVYQSHLAGTPTTEVVAEGQDGSQAKVLARWPGHPSAPVRTTIDAPVQQAANNAAAAAGTSAAVVAVQSSGRILAVADSRAAGLPRIDPLAGHYPPGGAFTIVSTEAVLATQLPVNATIRCTSVSHVGGKTFRNDPPVRLNAQPTFTADFTHSCGTAFASLSQRLQQGTLASAASGFGIGARWQLPLPAFSGSLPSAQSTAGKAADTIGQGDVQVSPLGMAMVAAHVDAGQWHPPTLTTGPAQTKATAPAAFPASRIQMLRNLMRAAVQSGAASGADVTGQQVYGQVGVAPVGKLYASWFVGYRGDVAFAVLQLSKSPRTSAASTAATFLNAAPAAG